MVAVLAGGCSADIARFDFASANLNDGSTGTIPTPSEPLHQRSNLIGAETGNNAPPPGAAPSYNSYVQPAAVQSAPSAQPSAPVASQPPPTYPQREQRVAALPSPDPRPIPRSTSAAERAELTKGELIEVQPGDTLYGLSRRHHVSMNDVVTLNGLSSPSLKPGQKLYLPQTRVIEKPAARDPAPAVAADIPSDWTGSHTVQQGENLYGLAARYRTKTTDLQRYNGITDVRRIKPGVVLRVPNGTEERAAPIAAAPAAGPAPGAIPPQALASETGAQPQPISVAAGGPTPTILNAPPPAPDADATRAGQRLAAAEPLATANDASPAPSAVPTQPGSGSVASTPKLRWPVEGKVISAFGRRPDSTHNDGVNVAVPQGTEIHAAEAGTVAYAGNELKGYGNLVLLRHDNGWVTAYAHADELLVKRGDIVKRGQVIARAGKTGQVDQPQVHFELRQGQKPVDPVPYMERM